MKRKILVIESNQEIALFISDILKEANYTVYIASTGKKGIILTKKYMPNLIICDVELSKLEGFEVLQIISTRIEFKAIPFILITENYAIEEIRKGIFLGASDFLSKPIQKDELLKIVNDRLKRAEAFDKKDNSVILLKKTKPFNFFENNKLTTLLINRPILTYLKGDLIYFSQNKINNFYVIKEGFVKTYVTNTSGKEFISNFYGDNNFFGHSTLFNKNSDLESAKALTKTQLYIISKNELINMLVNNHTVIYGYIEFLTAEINKYEQKLSLVSYGSVREKTAQTLIYLQTNFPNLFNSHIKLKRKDLANFAGIAKETLIRTLHDFNTEKLIKISKTGIKILNINKLSSVQ